MPNHVRYDDLPDDMRDLVDQFVTSTVVDGGGTVTNDRIVPDELPVVLLRLDELPSPPLDEFDRGIDHARAMDPSEVPPVIVIDGQFVDGRHRVFRFRELGLETIAAIDLSGIADPTMATCNSMGPVGPQAPSPSP